MKNLITPLAMVTIIFFGCSKEDKNYSSVHLDGIEIAVTNEEGEDLLDPNNPSSYRQNEIKLFYRIDGEVVEVYDSMMDNPRNFRIYKHESEYRIAILLNYDRNEEQPITYIQWNETDKDTIKAKFDYSGPEESNYSFTIKKVWFNGEVKDPYFEIVK